MVQTLLPTSTSTPDQWTPVGAATSHEAVDEGVDANDGDTTYIKVSFGGDLETRLILGAGSDPGVHSGHTLRVSFRKAATVGNPTTRIRVRLYQGAVAITGEQQTSAATTSYVTFEYTLSTAEAAAITDYTDLRVAILGPTPLVFAFDARVTAIELQLPEVAGDVVAWTLAEGASDAVAAALTAGISAKLDELDTEYADIVLPDVDTIYRNPMSVDDGVPAFPALAVYSPSGTFPILNNGGHADGSFEIAVQVLAKSETKATLQKYVYRYVRAAIEVLVEAWIASTLDGWGLLAADMTASYSAVDEGSEWQSGAVLTVQMNKLEAK